MVLARDPGAQFTRREREDLTHGVVEGTDGGEAGRERRLRHGEFGGLDEQPSGLGTLRPGQRQRARAEFGEELAFDLAGAVAEAGRESGHAFTVHDTVGDQPHGAGDQIGALVPLR